MFVTPYFSVIVPTRNRPDSLANCLARLARGEQALDASYYETIVTDDSTDLATCEMVAASFPQVVWVAGPQRGPAANRNNGAHHAAGEWLVFIDDDCLPEATCLASYLEAIRARPACSVFEGRIFVDRPRRSLMEGAPANESGGWLWSCNFAIKKSLFSDLKGFDERLPFAAMEDVELKRRLDLNGHKQVFVRAAGVCHPWRYSSLKEQVRIYESIKIYLSIHPAETKRINAMYHLKSSVRGLAGDLFRGLFHFKGRGLGGALLKRLWWFYVGVFTGVQSLWKRPAA